MKRLITAVLIGLLASMFVPQTSQAQGIFFEFCAKTSPAGRNYQPPQFFAIGKNHSCPAGYSKGSYATYAAWLQALNQFSQVTFKSGYQYGYNAGTLDGPDFPCTQGGPGCG